MDSCAITSGWRNAPVTGWEKEGGGYEGAYSNPELDALIAAALKEPDAAKRLKMYQEAEQMWINDAVFIPLYIYHNFFLVKPYVKGLYFPPVWELHFETVTIEK